MAKIQVNPDPTQVDPQILSEVYEVILQDNPNMGWLNNEGGVYTDDTEKFQWPDETRTEVTGTLDADYTAADTSLTLVSTAGFKAGDTIHIDGHTDSVGLDQSFRVTAVTNATTLAVTRVAYGTDTTLTNPTGGATIYRQGTVGDNRKPSSTEAMGTATEPTLRSNYVQLFEDSYEIGEKLLDTSRGGSLQGMEQMDIINKMRQEAMYRIMTQQYRAVVDGHGSPEVSGTGARMGGLMSFINTAATDNKVDAGANALAESDVNDLVEKLVNRGLPTGTPMAMIMNTANARIMSALRDNAVRVTNEAPGMRIGSSVDVYDSELSGWGGIRVIIDQKMKANKVLLVAMPYVALHTKAGQAMIREDDATVPGQLGIRRLLRSYLSLKVVGATNYHGVIWNIA